MYVCCDSQRGQLLGVVGPRDGTQVVKVGSKCLNTMGHLSGPLVYVFLLFNCWGRGVVIWLTLPHCNPLLKEVGKGT